ncbi:MAG: helix-turn-helix domain-containing protein [Dermatophilaceae bacterium]
MLAFRNVRADPADPVESWPYEGLVAAMERGGLRDWQRVAAAIERDPWGEVAADVMAFLSYEEPYGVGPLMKSVIAAARARAQDEDKAAVAARVRELVSSSGLTRRAFADAVGTSATRLSTYCTGSVTPSAALVLRMERASASRAARRSPAR